MRYISNEQVEQIFDTHEAFLARQLASGRLAEDEHEQEMRELVRWARRHSH